jgi:truncated hemoglobin YjbI
MATLFDKYGGFAMVSKIVMDFYDRVLESEIAGPFFDGIDMRRQIDHQTKFIAQILGAPPPIPTTCCGGSMPTSKLTALCSMKWLTCWSRRCAIMALKTRISPQ